MMRLDALAELTRQDAATGDRQLPPSGGCAAARLNTSSSMRAKSSCHGIDAGAARGRGKTRDLVRPDH